MSKKSLLLGAIASIIAINSVLADTTVTSRNYVDTQVATKQNKIDATGANFTNGSVVETTSTPGVVTQRAIFDPETGMIFPESLGDPLSFNDDHENDLLTAGSVMPLLLALQGTRGTVAVRGPLGFPDSERGIYDGSTTYDSSTDADKLVTASVVQNATNLPTKTVTYKTCTRWVDGQSHTDANCLLWSLNDVPIRAKQCYTDADCANAQGLGCSSPTCDAGVCFCGSR